MSNYNSSTCKVHLCLGGTEAPKQFRVCGSTWFPLIPGHMTNVLGQELKSKPLVL